MPVASARSSFKRFTQSIAIGLVLVVFSVSHGTVLAQMMTRDPVTGVGVNGGANGSANGGSNDAADNNASSDGPIRLRSSSSSRNDDTPSGNSAGTSARGNIGGSNNEAYTTSPSLPLRYQPGEFERFVQKQAGSNIVIRRFGADLMSANGNAELSPLVPADYLVAPGDEVLVTIWGSVDADLRLVVNRGGSITIPRVGPVQVSGVRYGALQDVVARRVSQVFKNFQLSVTLGALRGVRVFVTGFVVRPGTYTVSSLSTVVAALVRAGGPAASGSFRQVELRRGSQLISTFDLYDLLLKGDRSADTIVQAGDVIHVGPVGVQVGIVGSVNNPTVMELKPGEGVNDALRIAAGFSAVADRKRLAIERLEDRNTVRVLQLDLPNDATQSLSHGDVLRAFSAVDIASPSQRQRKRVKVEGEVMRPGEYVLPENSSIADALREAGGFTPNAYVFATEFNRESVRVTQQENYERALRDLETDVTKASASERITNADEAAGASARVTATSRLVERLRALKPSGRVVLQMTPDSTELPNLALEDGDRIYVPDRPSTIGVFGSVFNAASYLYDARKTLADYLRLAGGPTRGADEASVFVVRANGNVVSDRQSAGWFNRGSSVEGLPALPGDTVFVPEETNKTTFIQGAKDWTQILYQFGIGIAGIKAAGR